MILRFFLMLNCSNLLDNCDWLRLVTARKHHRHREWTDQYMQPEKCERDKIEKKGCHIIFLYYVFTYILYKFKNRTNIIKN